MTDERHDEDSPDDGGGEPNGDSPAFDPPEPGGTEEGTPAFDPEPAGNDNIREGRVDGLMGSPHGESQSG